MPKKTLPKRYFNIRIDEETYEIIKRIKKKTGQNVIDIVREGMKI